MNKVYTSKTCGLCGKIKQNLGGSEVFKCSECKEELDRDEHMVRNILLQFLTKYKIEESNNNNNDDSKELSRVPLVMEALVLTPSAQAVQDSGFLFVYDSEEEDLSLWNQKVLDQDCT